MIEFLAGLVVLLGAIWCVAFLVGAGVCLCAKKPYRLRATAKKIEFGIPHTVILLHSFFGIAIIISLTRGDLISRFPTIGSLLLVVFCALALPASLRIGNILFAIGYSALAVSCIAILSNSHFAPSQSVFLFLFLQFLMSLCALKFLSTQEDSDLVDYRRAVAPKGTGGKQTPFRIIPPISTLITPSDQGYKALVSDFVNDIARKHYGQRPAITLIGRLMLESKVIWTIGTKYPTVVILAGPSGCGKCALLDLFIAGWGGEWGRFNTGSNARLIVSDAPLGSDAEWIAHYTAIGGYENYLYFVICHTDVTLTETSDQNVLKEQLAGHVHPNLLSVARIVPFYPLSPAKLGMVACKMIWTKSIELSRPVGWIDPKFVEHLVLGIKPEQLIQGAGALLYRIAELNVFQRLQALTVSPGEMVSIHFDSSPNYTVTKVP